jgi:hypothetical protein
MSRRRAVLLAAALLGGALLVTGCGSDGKPKADPRPAAARVVDLIVHNKYSASWDDLYSADQKVAPFSEYVACETRNPVISVPRSVKVLSVNDESVGIGDGKFADSKAVDVRLNFAGGFHVVHTVHLVGEHGKWKYILPSWRFRDYRADKCPSDAGSSPPPSPS